MEDKAASFPAVWGAVLSTILALLKIHEMWRARERIDRGYDFKSLPELGNDVIIRNLSAKPQILTYWELQWRKRRLFRWHISERVSSDEYFQDIQIPPYSIKSLTFRVEDYFDLGV